MKTRKVRSLMVPLSEYATVSVDATLGEAVKALAQAQTNFDQTRYRHRAILVYGKGHTIVGKINQLDILLALEPKYGKIKDKRISQLGFSRDFLDAIQEQYALFEKPLEDAAREAAAMRVADFMHTPTEGEYVEIDASLALAVHQLVIGRHQSLLVIDSKKIVGILRLTDVFREVCTVIKGIPTLTGDEAYKE
jgi:CBS domain-containing protein